MTYALHIPATDIDAGEAVHLPCDDTCYMLKKGDLSIRPYGSSTSLGVPYTQQKRAYLVPYGADGEIIEIGESAILEVRFDDARELAEFSECLKSRLQG